MLQAEKNRPQQLQPFQIYNRTRLVDAIKKPLALYPHKAEAISQGL